MCCWFAFGGDGQHGEVAVGTVQQHGLKMGKRESSRCLMSDAGRYIEA